ncbi:MAG: Hsp20/alpha crystallin family protein [Polyangiaceae bacterium]|nr:Hsp20/alpha crystallin family protein [Polyangiaceae bacterium]
MLIRRVWPSRPTFESAFPDFDQLRREMMQLVDTLSPETYSEAGTGVFPPINIAQDKDNFYVRAEVPGVKAEQLSISALNKQVSISGKREIAAEREHASYHRRERAEGSFNRTVTLPTDIDASRVEARCASGILTVVLPKAEAAKPRQIVVKS